MFVFSYKPVIFKKFYELHLKSTNFGIGLRFPLKLGSINFSLQLSVLRSSDHPQVWWFSKRTHRTQYVVIITVMTYYSERRQSITKGKRQMGQSLEETWCKPPRIFSPESHMRHASLPQTWIVRTVVVLCTKMLCNKEAS